jgi:PhzF family phenazine biosynthesis protein
MPHPLHLVDAFANGPFTGNPAAIVLMDGPADETWMQKVAMEMNQAETAFLLPIEGGYNLRWFTPTIEVDLCGHATLAAAHVLFGLDQTNPTIRFSTRSGWLSATMVENEIELDFPAEAPAAAELPAPLQCLKTNPTWTGKNRMDWLVELPSARQVRDLQPDFAEIATLAMRGLIVTAQDETQEFDFVSRGFFPTSGINEDPVTGSAHCALAAYWAGKLGRNDLTGYQASTRGGIVKVTLAGDRVKLRGRAVTTVEGKLLA